MRPLRRRGYAAVLALLLLFLGTTLSAWLYAIVQNATAASRNEHSAARTQMVSESGLAFMQIKLHQALQATSITLGNDDGAMLVALGNALANQFPAGQVTITDSLPPVVHVASTTVKGGAFTATLTLSKAYEHGFNLGITGTAGSLSSTMGVEYEFTDDGEEPWGSYGMLSRGVMDISGSGGVYHWNSEEGKADKTPGQAMKIPGDGPNKGYALTFDSANPPADLRFPPKYLPDGDPPGEGNLYAKLDSMIGSSLQRFTQPQGTDKKGKATPAPVGNLANCYIPPNTPVTFGKDVTLTGIIYVGYPNNLQLGENVKLNAVIIYEKPKLDGSSTIDLSRTITAETDLTAALNAVEALFVASGETTENARTYTDMVYPWTIHAPDTDLNMQEGNTGSLSHWGSLHIRNILKSAGSGGGSQDDYVFHGTIVCEGTIDLRGNRKFSISPQNETPPARGPRYLSLAPRPGGYWENRP